MHVFLLSNKAKRNPVQGPILAGEARQMKISVKSMVSGAGRVVIGPKKVRSGYARIVGQKDGSGCIESFDCASRTWSSAPASVTFSEVWSAPAVPALLWAQIGDKS